MIEEGLRDQTAVVCSRPRDQDVSVAESCRASSWLGRLNRKARDASLETVASLNQQSCVVRRGRSFVKNEGNGRTCERGTAKPRLHGLRRSVFGRRSRSFGRGSSGSHRSWGSHGSRSSTARSDRSTAGRSRSGTGRSSRSTAGRSRSGTDRSSASRGAAVVLPVLTPLDPLRTVTAVIVVAATAANGDRSGTATAVATEKETACFSRLSGQTNDGRGHGDEQRSQHHGHSINELLFRGTETGFRPTPCSTHLA